MNDEHIVNDLRVFADPVTRYECQAAEGGVRIEMIRDGEERDYLITDVGTVNARHSKRKFTSVAALLASDEFANVKALRATQRRMLAERMSQMIFLEPEGHLERASQTEALRLNSFRDATRPEGVEALSIILMDGPAGIGKTSLIQRLVWERTEPASALPPLLHVTSSGSRLTDLSKALAHATQILRARVAFDEVPILARHGVIQVAIDGFDELVDPEGYKDAWSALREFLREVQSGGPVILSGRDTFFDQQRFSSQLIDRIPSLKLIHARLGPASKSHAKEFLTNKGWSAEEVELADRNGWLKAGSYRLRPFFLAQIASLGGWSVLEQSFGTPRSFLVKTFVAREAGLIAEMVDIPIAKATDGLWQFYGAVVEDMATQESDLVDEPFLSLACETAFADVVPSESLGKLVQKAGSIGLLESAEQTGMRRFPHSELQYQFLAHVLVQRLTTSAAIATFLRRSVVPMGLAEAFSYAVDKIEEDQATMVRERLVKIGQEDAFAERLVSNAAALLLSTASRPNLPEIVLSGVTVNEARLLGTIEGVKLSAMSILNLDVRGANLTRVHFDDCSIGVLTVDEETRFGEHLPSKVTSLQIDRPESGTVESVRDPALVQRWLGQHSTQASVTQDESGLRFNRYFDRLCRRFVRQHQIRANISDEGYALIKDPLWSEALSVLGDRMEVVKRTKAQSGPADVFYRMKNPEGFLALGGLDAQSAAILEKVRERAKQIG